MRKIVVGTDGSPGSINALRWAANLAAAPSAEIVVMTGWLPHDSGESPSRSDDQTAHHPGQLDEWCRAAELDPSAVRHVVRHGDARPEILAVATEHDADLVVVGRQGSSAGPGLLHLGSTAEWLAHHSDQPIAVIGGAVNTSIRRVIVGVDGSTETRAALDWVAELARHREIEIIVASVTDDSVTWSASSDFETWSMLVEDRIRTDWALPLVEREVPFAVHTSWRRNHADSLLEAARHERADVVVVGMRGTGGFPGLRVGGVALKVLHRADRPVVLTPPHRR